MSKREQFGQTKNLEKSEVLKGGVESREQFGDRVLQAAQEVYADEVQALEKKSSEYNNLKNLATVLAIPGGIYIIGKFFGLDETMGLNVSDSVDASLRLSWAISMLSTGCLSFVETHFDKKLLYLKDKFGMLSKPEDKETE